MSNVFGGTREEKLKFLQEQLEKIPPEHRWRFYVEDPPEVYGYTGGALRSDPYIVDITAPKVINKSFSSGGRCHSSDNSLGVLGAGVAGYLIGSSFDS
jgi:hypothetical protein